MNGICVNGDISLGADGCCPITTWGATSDVFVNGSLVITLGDVWGMHECGGDHCGHAAICVTGNPSVLVNGRPVVTDGMLLSCGDITSAKTPNVYVGG